MDGRTGAAAFATGHVGRRWDGFEKLARRAPYFSGAFIVCIGLYVGYHGVATLVAQGAATHWLAWIDALRSVWTVSPLPGAAADATVFVRHRLPPQSR